MKKKILGILVAVFFSIAILVSCTDTINPSNIVLSESSLTLKVGDSETLVATIEPTNATDKSVTWSSSDDSVVTVSEAGELTAVGVGNATITAKTSNDLTETCVVTVEKGLIKVGIIGFPKGESGYSSANIGDLEAVFTEANGYKVYSHFSISLNAQFAAFNTFVEEKVDYILLSPIEEQGWDVAMRNAANEGIPVLIFNRLIENEEYTVAVISDLFKQGETAVNWLLDQDVEGEEINVLHIQGDLGSKTQRGRTKALEDAERENRLNIVLQETGNWDYLQAMQIVAQAISEGINFNVIYAENDSMAYGAAEALDAAGISHGVGGDVIIISFDCNKWALEKLLAGEWNYDVQLSPFQASYLHETIQNLEKGIQPEEKIIYVKEIGFDARTITQEDIDNGI